MSESLMGKILLEIGEFLDCSLFVVKLSMRRFFDLRFGTRRDFAKFLSSAREKTNNTLISA